MKDQTKLQELEKQIEAIILHIGNTKDFLEKEAMSIHIRVNQLQT
jgi:hypothetical protein